MNRAWSTSNSAASDAYALRGEAFAALGDPGQALSSFRSYLASEPVGGYVAFRAAEIAAAAGDVNAAGDLYRRALDLGMNAWWVTDELQYALKDSAPKIVFCDEERLSRMLERPAMVAGANWLPAISPTAAPRRWPKARMPTGSTLLK